MITCVSLFRAINVGGRRKVRMDELKEVHESLGFMNVSSYIQSGNVVFTCDDEDISLIRERIEESFEKRFGFHSDVFVRTLPELQAIIEKNPFQDQEDREPKWIVIMFLATHPDTLAQESLLKSYSGPEEMFVLGNELYIYYPNGIGTSKLSNNMLERKLQTVGTARNLNTILELRKRMV